MISDRLMDQAFSDLKGTCGGVRNDYFALLYLELEYGLDRKRAIPQVAFSGKDYGIDAFHFDAEKGNLYLFQFKYSQNYRQFESSFERLTNDGMERIFAAQTQDQHQNQLLQQLKSCIAENEDVINRVCIHFVFMGDPEEAERSTSLNARREDLENKKYLIDQRFGRNVVMLVEFRSARTRKVGGLSHVRKTHKYPLELGDTIRKSGPNGETMVMGFISLTDLNKMYKEMGQRFFERNIRAALPEDKAVNRSIQRSIKRIAVDGTENAALFAFHHNGVTLFAEALQEQQPGLWDVVEPRLLNGAQSVSTFARFLKANDGNGALQRLNGALSSIQVPCRIITNATTDFVTTVTINNNRQNPVDPWNLRSNDQIQLQIQDKFRDDLEIFYERQEEAFVNLSDDDLEEQGITQQKAIEFLRLARTYLASDGNIDKFSRFREVFEDDKIYSSVFNESRLLADSRKILLCYKIQFRLRKCAKDIEGLGAKYTFINKARNLLWALLCQAVLNDAKIDVKAEQYGRGLTIEADYTGWISAMATKQCRLILLDLIKSDDYADRASEGNWGFLRSNAAYEMAMGIAYDRYGWVKRHLRK